MYNNTPFLRFTMHIVVHLSVPLGTKFEQGTLFVLDIRNSLSH